MALNLFLIIGSFYILKPVRSSVFLVSFGPAQLPYVFMLIAVIGGGIATVYSRMAPLVRLSRLVVASSLITVAILVLFRLLMPLNQGWVSYAFYIVVSLYGVITTSQFWLLANNIFDSREARRLFGYIGAGGIAGSIAGSAVASTAIRILGVEDLILIAAFLLGLSALVAVRVWAIGGRLTQAGDARARMTSRSSHGRGEGGGGVIEMFRLIRGSRYLALLTGIIGLAVISSTFVDYILSAEAFEHYTAKACREQAVIVGQEGGGEGPGDPRVSVEVQVKNELTTFFGRFNGAISIVSLVLQLGLVGRILGGLGVGWANLLLPTGLLLSSGGILVLPVLVTAVATRLIDGALSYSVAKAGTELLFIPLPPAIKNRTKTFIDLFTDRLSRGIAGLLLLLLTGVLAVDTRGVAVVLIAVLALWFILLERMHGYRWRDLLHPGREGSGGGEYLAAFGRAVAGRTLDVEGIRDMVRSPDAIRVLAESLAGDERQVVYTLRLLESADSDLLAPHLVPLLGHPSADVRRLAITKLAESKDTAHRQEVGPLIDDPERAVRREAVHYLARSAPEGEETYLRELLAAPDWRTRGAALEVIARHLPRYREWIEGSTLDSLLLVEGRERADARAVVARAIAALGPGTPLAARLEELLRDPDPAVRREAMTAAGEVRDPRHLEHLLAGLGRPHERRTARAALARYGETLIPFLGSVLDDEEADVHVREQIPRTLRLMQSQPAVDMLLSRLGHPSVLIRFQVLRALGKMRARDRAEGDRLRFELRLVEARVLAESRDFFELLAALRAVGGAPQLALLRRALRERLDQNLERIFRLLGIRYPAENLLFAYNGVLGGNQALRANAIEFMDNLLAGRLKRAVMPVVIEVTREIPGRVVPRDRPVDPAERDEYLRAILAGDDRWLVVCGIDAVRGLALTGFERDIAAHRESPHPLVREAVALAMG